MKKLYFLFFTILISTASFGQIILTDNFDYPDGSLVGNGNWVNHSGTSGDLLVSDGKVQVQHGTPSEDANDPFTPVSGDIYFAIDFSVADLGAPYSGGNDFEYFAHFMSDQSFKGRLDVVAPSGSGDFSVGISSGSSTAQATWPTDLTYGVTYRAVVKYDQVNNTSQLWIDAYFSADFSIEAADDGTSAGEVSGFALRQSDSSENELIIVDNLVVSQTFSETLSVVENQIEGFAMYPNPVANGKFTITSNSSFDKNVEIYSMLGKRLVSKTVKSNETIDISNLTTGFYMVRVEEEGKVATRKLLVK